MHPPRLSVKLHIAAFLIVNSTADGVLVEENSSESANMVKSKSFLYILYFYSAAARRNMCDKMDSWIFILSFLFPIASRP